jgi:hypothetical protein
MMTTMLALTLLTLLALFFILKRLRPLSQKPVINEIKDEENNTLNNSSSIEDDSDEPTVSLPTKSCYVTLVQHTDEQNEYLCNKNSKRNSLTKRLSNNLDSHINRYDTSSTNVLCLPDEQQRILKNDLTESSSHIS